MQSARRFNEQLVGNFREEVRMANARNDMLGKVQRQHEKDMLTMKDQSDERLLRIKSRNAYNLRDLENQAILKSAQLQQVGSLARSLLNADVTRETNRARGRTDLFSSLITDRTARMGADPLADVQSINSLARQASRLYGTLNGDSTNRPTTKFGAGRGIGDRALPGATGSTTVTDRQFKTLLKNLTTEFRTNDNTTKPSFVDFGTTSPYSGGMVINKGVNRFKEKTWDDIVREARSGAGRRSNQSGNQSGNQMSLIDRRTINRHLSKAKNPPPLGTNYVQAGDNRIIMKQPVNQTTNNTNNRKRYMDIAREMLENK